MGWLIALAILIIFLFLPVGIRVLYGANGFFLTLLIGPVRIQLFPVNKNKPKKKKPQQDKKKDKKAKETKKKEDKSGGSITDFLPLVGTALSFLNAFRKKLRIDKLEMRLVLADPDPCDLSIQYGRGWAILGNTLPLVEQIFVIKRRNLEIACDYTADVTTVYVSANITILIGRLLYIALRYGIQALKQYFDMKKSKKAVQNNESKSS